MPCYDPRDHEDRAETARKMQAATRAACDALGMLEATGFDMKRLQPETQIWWREHKQWDALRLRPVVSGAVPTGTVEFWQDGKLVGRITGVE